MKNKFLNLFKKKKIVSLSDFAKAVKKIANSHNEDYYTAEIKYHSTDDCLKTHGANDITFQGYINGFEHAQGHTIKEVCDRLLSQKQAPKESPIADVIIEEAT